MKCRKCGNEEWKRDWGYVLKSIAVGFVGSILFGMGDATIVAIWLIVPTIWGLGHRRRVCQNCGKKQLKE